jgi:hypothetical protein
MNNATYARSRRLQGHYPVAEMSQTPEVHPIKAEIAKNIGSYSFVATFEEDREALAAFNNPGLIAYKCVLKTSDGRVLGIGHGINVLSMENRYLSKSVKWAHSGAFIAAVTNAVKFPTLDGSPAVSDFGVGNSEIASAFMATDKQKSYLRELIMSLPEEDGREELLSNLDSMTKEDASEMIQQLKN